MTEVWQRRGSGADKTVELGSPTPARTLEQRPAALALVVGVAVWLLGVAYVAVYLQRDWFPHDEGLLGQSAWRVLQGQWPHRDFGDAYTGGLSFLHALAFAVFGVKLTSLRLVLLLAVALWIPAVYWIGSRFLSPLGAALCAALAVTWSVPNYSAAMPSWYNLFFATWAVAATLRYLDTGHLRWLITAGVMGGLSCLVKIVGLYLLLGIGLFLVYEAQSQPQPDRPTGRRNLTYPLIVAAGVLMVTAAVARLTWSVFGTMALYHFVVPTLLLGVVLVVDAFRVRVFDTAVQLRRLARLVLPFAGGALAPLAAFALVYAMAGAGSQLAYGVLVAPFVRLQFAAHTPPPLADTATTLVLALAVIAATALPGLWAERVGNGIAGAAVVCLIGAGTTLGYFLLWRSATEMLPPIVAIGMASLLRTAVPNPADRGRQQVAFLLLAVATCCSLVAYPYGSPIYFLYSIPLVFLAATATLALRAPLRPWVAITAACYVGFAVIHLVPGTIRTLGFPALSSSRPKEAWARLSTPRGGLMIGRADSVGYESAIALLKAHATGPYTYAAPDAPEIYFLSGLENPTTTMHEFLDPPTGRTERVLESLRRRDVTAIAINRSPRFSGPLPPALMDSLRTWYPDSASTPFFVIRWRS